MTGWTFHNPVNVTFGIDAFDGIGRLANGRSYVLVTYPGSLFERLAERVAALAGTPLAVIDAIEPNPSLASLNSICAQLGALPQPPELLIALGGGSVIDSAKFLAAGHGQWQPVLDYIENGRSIGCAALPILAIPTTSGTGSEVTSWATVWDPERDRKLSLASADLYPETVVVDPRLVVGLPWQITLSSGLDALSHALESLWNVNANPVTRGFAIPAARDIMDALVRLHDDLDDLDARSQAAFGSLQAGLAFSNTKTALAHNISYPISLRHGVAHGIACSFCLPDVMAAALGTDPVCDAAIGQIFGDIASAPARLRAFLDTMGIAGDPADYGIGPGEWREIVTDAFAGPRGRNFIGSIDRFPFGSPVLAAERT